ncbi:DUF2913 family protein [Shewanella sp. Isolate11]|uniref:DUF2913 family protein n=1 Tax=Shewanella sp. Isolate11 TaxID=2908530 RepID=UPI001EFDF8AB|nr:DUF2913 family protein [Shewanella sp. Isolate11]MCG9695857.1 DUF2913 family protein [Shewanella sp. Isolate11]
MTQQTYNKALLELAQAGLEAVKQRDESSTAMKTPAAESHFICSWMVQSLKERRFSKLVADDLTQWIRQGRSMGAGANLKGLLMSITNQYQQVKDTSDKLGDKLALLLSELEQQDWLIFTDSEVDTKLKLDSDGQASLIISAPEYEQHIVQGEMIKPINMYVRGDEQQLAKLALQQGLLISQGNKKTALVKHHKTYRLYPKNQQPALALLVDSQDK